MKYYIAYIVLFCFSSQLLAQHEYIDNLSYNPALSDQQKTEARKRGAGDTLELPFIDDFSYQQTNSPDPDRWEDKQVFINNTYPVNQRSYGVATFDGLNEFGQPYGIDPTGVFSTRSYGGADTLTSKCIDLSGKVLSDSLYLKFMYQPQGVGDFPNRPDSLVLEFKKLDTVWQKVWGIPGFTDTIGTPVFIDTAILLNDAFYLVNNFQFRFRNNGSIIGNNDHWHLDYVYMSDTTVSLTGINDMAVQKEPTNFLKNYTTMPWYQFQGFESQETVPNISFCFNNNYNQVQSSFFGYTTVEELTNTPVFTRPPSAGNFNFLGTSDTCFTLPSDDIINNLPNTNADSVVIATTVTINKQNLDVTTENDTITQRVEFFNLLAYDDGSVEKEYGLLGGTGQIKKFAMRFVLNKPDTLRAVKMLFTRINSNPADELFSFYIWRKLDLDNSGSLEDTLYIRDFQRPLYVDSINGFATFKLDTPLIIQDTVYVGWQQVTDKSIGIGLDVNNDATDHMFYFANSQWFQSSLYGAPMIRILVGKDVPIAATGISEQKVEALKQLKVYPNPANTYLQLQVDGLNISKDRQSIDVFDISGRKVSCDQLNDLRLDVSNLQQGMYIIQVLTENERFVSRFIKQ